MLQSVEKYLISLTAGRSPQTITWYRKRLAPLKTLDQNISSITLFDLQQLYSDLANRKVRWSNHPSGRSSAPGGLSPVTLRGYVRAWRVFFNWCVANNLIASSPAHKLKLPRMPDQPPKAIERSVMDRLIETARLSSARDYAIVCILADSACRVGGLCAITLDNLDLDRSQAIVIEKGQARFLLFTPRTVEAIRVYLLERPDVPARALFIGQKRTPLKPNGIYQLLDRLAERAGIDGRHNPHAFRHGWARQALEQHADISDVAHVLGHNQIQTTYQFYGRWNTRELHEIHRRYTPLAPEAEDIVPTTNQAE